MSFVDHRNIEAKAQSINDEHGTRGVVVIAEKISATAAAKDQDELDHWLAVATQYIRLQRGDQAQWHAARHMRKLLDSLL